jgi:acetyl esterase/lipase
MPSNAADTMIASFREWQLGPEVPARTWEELRAMSAQMAAAQPAPEGVDTSRVELAGVPVDHTRVPGVDTACHVVYVHGGGYVCGSASGQQAFVAELARAASADVWAVEYRLAPEHRCPAAIDDVIAATVAVQSGAGDVPVVVGGDSAGGGLAVAAVLEMRARALELPRGLFALSPWTDMTLTNRCFDDLATRDVMVRKSDLAMMRDCYLGDADPAAPHASPGLADLTGLPPVLVQVGGEEVLLGDAQLLVDRATRDGVQAELEVADGMFHTWQVIAPGLPESQHAISSLARFLTRL